MGVVDACGDVLLGTEYGGFSYRQLSKGWQELVCGCQGGFLMVVLFYFFRWIRCFSPALRQIRYHIFLIRVFLTRFFEKSQGLDVFNLKFGYLS